MKNKKTFILLVILAILVIAAGGLVIYKILTREKAANSEPVSNTNVAEDKGPLVVQEKKVQIFSGKDRPIAVMIDNHSGAWPQANLNKAYMVYEIIVEGGETRLMALFKGQDLDKIGPIRS